LWTILHLSRLNCRSTYHNLRLHPFTGNNGERIPIGGWRKLFSLLESTEGKEAIMKKLFLLVALLFFVSVQPALSAELIILTENLPPLNYVEDGVRNSEKGRIPRGNQGLPMGKSVPNGSGAEKCCIVWHDTYRSTP
jgi:hypothetical protein